MTEDSESRALSRFSRDVRVLNSLHHQEPSGTGASGTRIGRFDGVLDANLGLLGSTNLGLLGGISSQFTYLTLWPLVGGHVPGTGRTGSDTASTTPRDSTTDTRLQVDSRALEAELTEASDTTQYTPEQPRPPTEPEGSGLPADDATPPSNGDSAAHPGSAARTGTVVLERTVEPHPTVLQGIDYRRETTETDRRTVYREYPADEGGDDEQLSGAERRETAASDGEPPGSHRRRSGEAVDQDSESTEIPTETGAGTGDSAQQVRGRSTPHTLVTSRPISILQRVTDEGRRLSRASHEGRASTTDDPAGTGGVAQPARDVRRASREVDDIGRDAQRGSVSLGLSRGVETAPARDLGTTPSRGRGSTPRDSGQKNQTAELPSVVDDNSGSVVQDVPLVVRDESSTSGTPSEGGQDSDSLRGARKASSSSDDRGATDSAAHHNTGGRATRQGERGTERSTTRRSASGVPEPGSVTSDADLTGELLDRVEVSRFVDRLYRELERKDRIERERRGL